jgi:Asp-tRNA(Asn)/Glu-tRNA(Gln) amidotransferase A subunit family amidase
MPSTDEKLKLSPKPYLSATAAFAGGADTPRDFLERCLADLDRLEPQIGAFVHLSVDAARVAADQSTKRWRDGKPLSKIDGMPMGIKDIIETIDMPTEQGSPLFTGVRTERDAASVAALREAGAVIVGKTVTTEFAASEPRGTRNPHDLRRTPGGSSSGSAAGVAAGMISTGLGTQVIGSTIRPGSYCGCIAFRATVGALNRGGSYDGLSQSSTGVLATTLEDTWQVAYEIAQRAGGDPGFPGLYGPPSMPAVQKPKRIAFIETAGWAAASPGAKAAMDEALGRLKGAGIAVLTRANNAKVAATETAIASARPISMRINAWEGRWPLNTYRNRDASKLSRVALERLTEAEAMTLDDYRADLKTREEVRAVYEALKDECDMCVSLSAPAAAPIGLQSTGDPNCTVHVSLLAIPAISLPVMLDEGLPLGLQVTGFQHGDAAVFAASAAIEQIMGGK